MLEVFEIVYLELHGEEDPEELAHQVVCINGVTLF